MMQTTRRIVQLFIFMILMVVPLVNYYGIKVDQKADAVVDDSFVLSLIDRCFEGHGREQVAEWTHLVNGSVWTMNVNGFKVSDPLAVVESTVVSRYVYWPLVLSLLIPALITVVLGRVYCGWICPMHLLLEINAWLRKGLEKVGYGTMNVSFGIRTKYYVLLLGLLVASLLGMPVLVSIYPPAVISREIFAKVYTGIFGYGIFFLCSIVFVELILSKRFWCRYICPGGAVYVFLSRFKLLRIKRDDQRCTDCGACDPVCPYDLKPMTKSLGAECDNCSLCRSACGFKALKYTFTLNHQIEFKK